MTTVLIRLRLGMQRLIVRFDNEYSTHTSENIIESEWVNTKWCSFLHAIRSAIYNSHLVQENHIHTFY